MDDTRGSDRLLYRPAEIAEMLGFSRSKVYELIKRNEIPSVRVGGSVRIPAEPLREWARSPGNWSAARGGAEAPASQ